MKPRSVVFDLFGDYLRYRGGQAPLRDVTALLGQFGIGSSTTRVVMSRLRKEGWFDTRRGKDGREVVYVLNERSLRMLDAGRERIFADPHFNWDGWWHMVIYYVPETERSSREELRKELAWLGFGPLAAATWISPHNRLAKVQDSFAHKQDVRLDLLRSRSNDLFSDRDMAERCWDLDALNADYTTFLERYRAAMPSFRSGRLAPSEALLARTELLQEWRKFPFRDPVLPVELLPARWRGHDAYQMFIEAAECLRSGAERAIDEVTSNFRSDDGGAPGATQTSGSFTGVGKWSASEVVSEPPS